MENVKNETQIKSNYHRFLPKSWSTIESGLQQVKKSCDNNFDTMLKEMNEIEEKRLNVVIFGLPETQTQDRSTARDLDVGCLDGILEKITGHKMDFDVKFHIGAKAENKIRPIVVKVSSLQAKEELLKKSATLQDHQQWKDVYIKPDLTKLQRTLFKKHED